MEKITWTVKLRIGVRWDAKANIFVGYCPALNLCSQGRTADEARTATFGAAKSYLSIQYKRGKLTEALASSGFEEDSSSAEAGEDAMGEPQEFIGFTKEEFSEMTVPFDLKSLNFNAGWAQQALQPA